MVIVVTAIPDDRHVEGWLLHLAGRLPVLHGVPRHRPEEQARRVREAERLQ